MAFIDVFNSITLYCICTILIRYLSSNLGFYIVVTAFKCRWLAELSLYNLTAVWYRALYHLTKSRLLLPMHGHNTEYQQIAIKDIRGK